MKQKNNMLTEVWQRFLLVWRRTIKWILLLFICLFVMGIIAIFAYEKDYGGAIYRMHTCLHRFPSSNRHYSAMLDLSEQIEANPKRAKIAIDKFKQSLVTAEYEDSLNYLKYQAENDTLTDRMDSIQARLVLEYDKIRECYDGKTERLKVTKTWCNNTNLPLTYDAYKKITANLDSCNLSELLHQFSTTIEKASAKDSTSYLEDQAHTYVNIIFDNHLFHRVSVQDNPDWLLLRPGDYVECSYSLQKTKEQFLSDIALGKFSKVCYPETLPLNDIVLTELEAIPANHIYKTNFTPVFNK